MVLVVVFRVYRKDLVNLKIEYIYFLIRIIEKEYIEKINEVLGICGVIIVEVLFMLMSCVF